jgi:sugar-specific transcriptional regulator TrmB
MSLARILRTLSSFGFTKAEAEVYTYLAKKGPQKDRDLAKVLRMTEQELRPTLRNLQNKGVVIKTVEQSALFSAVAFEKVLASFVKANIEEASTLQERKEELLASWRSMTERNDT